MKRLVGGFLGLALIGGLHGCLGPTGRPVLQRAAPPTPVTIRPSKIVYALPLSNARVLSPYGPRGRRFHTGIDLIRTRGGGDPVLVAAGGRVVRVGLAGRYGRLVEVLHADGYKTRYAHLRQITVRVGDLVMGGDPCGSVGKTGRATTAHLHFEIVAPSGQPVDPKRYLAWTE